MSDSNPIIDFSNAEQVLVKHSAGPAPAKGKLTPFDMQYKNNGVRGERFIFNNSGEVNAYDKLGVNDNSFNVIKVGDDIFIHTRPGQKGDIFRGKASSKKKSKEEKLPKLAELLQNVGKLNTLYLLENAGEYEGTPVYKMIPVGEPAKRFGEEDSEPQSNEQPAAPPQPEPQVEERVSAQIPEPSSSGAQPDDEDGINGEPEEDEL